MEKIIEDLIYDPKYGLSNEGKLYKKLKKDGIEITHSQLNDLLKRQYFYQVTKEQREPKRFNIIWSPYVGFNYQMDIMVYNRFKYNNYQYILCIIDVHSRYAACRGMTNVTDANILKNMKSIFEEIGIPKTINCDLEFNTKLIKKYAEENDIKFYFSEPYDKIKNSIVERFNYTLARLLNKYRIAAKRYDWNNYLNDIVFNYNHNFHSGIRAVPNDVFNGKDFNHQPIRPNIKHEFNVGDKVRIKVKKSIFDKNDITTYSKEVYRIEKVDKNKIYLFDVERSFQPHQLLESNRIGFQNVNDAQEREVMENKIIEKQNKALKDDGLSTKNIVKKKRVAKKKKDDDFEYF